jgi:metal-responsive CopG/Arc/MetJ family transcriptional regulator
MPKFMKTAIAIPDDLFEEVERFSKRRKVSRSRLFTDAVREYLARQDAPSDPTTLWN